MSKVELRELSTNVGEKAHTEQITPVIANRMYSTFAGILRQSYLVLVHSCFLELALLKINTV